MKHLLLFVILFVSFQISAQEIDECLDIPLQKAEEVNQAEPCILKLSDYVLSQPLQGGKNQGKSQLALAKVISWMSVTPHYTFELKDNKLMKIFQDKENELLFGIYMVTLTKAALTKQKPDAKYALELFVNYVKNPKNKVKQTKAIKKLIKDWEKGKIDAYIK